MNGPMQFVACNDITCPFNQTKQCRAPFIAIGPDGKCLIRDGGPFENKSETEKYVEIRTCLCQKCNYWELDEARQVGSCGFREDLFFSQARDEDKALGKPECDTYKKQISQPGFTAPL